MMNGNEINLIEERTNWLYLFQPFLIFQIFPLHLNVFLLFKMFLFKRFYFNVFILFTI